MSKPPPKPFDQRQGETIANVKADAAPALRLRFDPPPPGAFAASANAGETRELDEVINNVEQLSLGIDTMLRRANSTSLGMNAADGDARAANGFDDDDDESTDDEPMMAMFDEEAAPPTFPPISTSTDIHAIDRMLATQAECAMHGDIASAKASAFDQPGIVVAAEAIASRESSAEQDAEEVMLEGDFEDINALIEKSVPAFVPPAADMPVPVSSSPTMRETESHRVEPTIDHESAAEQAAAVSAEEFATASQSHADRQEDERPLPPPVLDLSLAPEQAQGIAAALAAASGAGAGAGAGLAAPHSHAIAAHAPEPIVADAAPIAAPRDENSTVAPAVQQTPTANAAAHETAIKDVATRSVSTRFASIGGRIVEVIALTNLPLRMVPKSMQHAVNLVAVSLALWAPTVWALGPKIAAARQASHATAAPHDDAHDKSSSKADAGGHGESKDAHDEKASPKKSSSFSKKSSGKKSSAKKADAAPSGGH